MARDIKFRAWDKKSKKMRVVESIGFGAISIYEKGYPVCNMIGYDIIEEKAIIIHRDSPHFELMQSTGLHDRNDKEIYEDDIVVIVGESGYFVIEWADTEAKWIMYNKADCYSVDFDNYWSSDTEVVGNKFDNPELLELVR